jgi:hypothetical protein
LLGLAKHWRDKHNKDGMSKHLFDHDHPQFAGRVAFCQPCGEGEGPFCCNRGGIARHKCKQSLLATQTARRAGELLAPLAGQLSGGRIRASRPRPDGTARGADADVDDDTNLDAGASPEQIWRMWLGHPTDERLRKMPEYCVDVPASLKQLPARKADDVNEVARISNSQRRADGGKHGPWRTTTASVGEFIANNILEMPMHSVLTGYKFVDVFYDYAPRP